MRVSVVIPCYNSGLLLESAVRSAANQTLAPLEILCIDDASTNDTRPRLEMLRAELGERLVILAQPERHGIGAARNLGLQHARGEWIALLDHDDLWLPGKLERQSALAAAHPDAVLLHARCWEQQGDDASTRVLMHEGKAFPSGDPFAPLFLANSIVPCTVLMARSAILDAGGFDPRLDRHGKDDLDLFLKLAERGGRFACADEPLAVRRLHGANFSADHVAFHRGRFDVLLDAFLRDRADGRRLLVSEALVRLFGVLFDRLLAALAAADAGSPHGDAPEPGAVPEAWRALETFFRSAPEYLASATSPERMAARFPALTPLASSFARRRRPALHHGLETAMAARAALDHAEFLLAARQQHRERDTASAALLRRAAEAAGRASRRAARRRTDASVNRR